MFTKLQSFFQKYLNKEEKNTVPIKTQLQLASAALMVEMIHVDENVTTDEEDKIRHLIKQRYELNKTEIDDLIQLAHDEKHEATDYFAFTSLLNTHYSQQQKINLIEDLWQLAYSDENLNKYEEHLLRKLSELLHIPHKDLIRTKHHVLKENA